MLSTPRAQRGMVTSPHHLASEAGLRVLREGGNAIEAALATAATLCVVYPHMTGIGGDGFWLVAAPGREPVAIEACGPAAAGARIDLYRGRGLRAVPWRGPLAANTVAGTVGGWDLALRLSGVLGGRFSLQRLLEDAVWHAEEGYAVTASQAQLTAERLGELAEQPGFAATFLEAGRCPAEGAVMRLPALGRTLRRLGKGGCDGFYRGSIAADMAADLARIGSPVSRKDLARYRARRVRPLRVQLAGARLFNTPPPTQGLASLMILALFERLGVSERDGFAHIHGLVEATKQAFLVRDRIIGDPGAMEERPADYLNSDVLGRLAQQIDKKKPLPWPYATPGGDTVWLGAVDAQGVVVSFIQSLYFEFGSGVVLPETGILWQNRGASFLLAGVGPRLLAPGRKPFHTLNPALARLVDGRIMVYGTMGGEGQPQTQAAIFSRYAMFGQDLQAAVTAPRWLLGKTWGEDSVTLKLESRFDPTLVDALRAAGHDVDLVAPYSSIMGHAGALVRHDNGVIEGAADPRSDGAAIGY
ncbi:MAG TPA: gamma-glutamyltransferase family protein [Hyphomicrobiaceae bacterium]|nr:gamma-glutamyltransferase family protein [Hyphomicrobiaceae bacterium]